uniref:Gypsy retrotransposon integrase-like protein 1 n=1 Tax=Oryzias latipes TaxID=8090 RepID=A0A3B3ILD1_ORYLA
MFLPVFPAEQELLLPSLSVDDAELQQLQREEADISVVVTWLDQGRTGPPPVRRRGSSIRLRKLWTEFSRLSIVNGLLCHTVLSSPGSEQRVQIVVPSVIVPDLLERLHGGPAAAHFSAERVWEKAMQNYYWPFMLRDIRQWCEQCRACQTRRSPAPKPKAPMGGLPVNRPLQRVAADILELPVTSRGNRYVLVVEDYFTKFVNLYALPNQTAQTVARCLFEDYVLVHGIPEVLHSDQGRQFEAEVIKFLCQWMGTKKTRTTAYHPKSDGMVERHKRTVIDQLAKMLLSHGGEWDEFLKVVCFAYNTTKHSSTHFSPYYLLHGREARVPADVLVPSSLLDSQSAGSLPAYASGLVARLSAALSAARLHAAEAHEKQKLYHDEDVRHRPFVVGALVWLSNPVESRTKLAPHWKGPYRVEQVLTSGGEVALTYRIMNPYDPLGKALVVHRDRLKPYTLPMPAISSGTAHQTSPIHRDPGGPLQPREEGLPERDASNTVPEDNSMAVPGYSRCGRRLKPPSWFHDFVQL